MLNPNDEAMWEKKLNISTAASDYEKDDRHHNRYEPTPYAVLERLCASGWLKRDNVLIDYGCGKGRVSFFANHLLGIKSVGVEYNPEIHAAAERNLESYRSRKDSIGRLAFACESAENYAIGGADSFYFFNPFSAGTLKGVVGKIIASYFDSPRDMRLFFYYPTDEYSDYLMSEYVLQLAGEIDCRDLFPGDDSHERILIFRIAYEM